MEILIFPAIFVCLILLPAIFADNAIESKKADKKQTEIIEQKEMKAVERALDLEQKEKRQQFADTQFVEYIQSKLAGYDVIYITGYKETTCRKGLSVSFIHRFESEEKRESVIIPAPLAS